jgi:glycine dehydrogenase subunit 2
MVLKAPHLTRTPRVDEVTAARKPVVRWKPATTASQAAD